jgi:hypothetical protein
MKGKLLIALVVLALIFGLGLASCDNGAVPKIDNGASSGKDSLTLDDSFAIVAPNTDPSTTPVLPRLYEWEGTYYILGTKQKWDAKEGWKDVYDGSGPFTVIGDKRAAVEYYLAKF